MDKGIVNVAFSGGEPLMKKGIEELIEYTASLNAIHIETVDGQLVETIKPPKIYVISNGGIMNDAFLDLCQKHNIFLSMSLPGLKTYKYHTQTGSPEKILHWFTEAKKREISTTVNITATKKIFTNFTKQSLTP